MFLLMQDFRKVNRSLLC
jgi:hypothetical protein